MDSKNVSIIATALLAGLLLNEAVRDVPEDTKPLNSQREIQLQPEKLARFPDGGKGYVVEVLTDAGSVELRTTTAKCVRAPFMNTTCLHREPDGGARFIGEYNRFPASEAAGSGCESVACSVYVGENADENEDSRLVKEVVDGGRGK